MDNFPAIERAILAALALRGLRAGALPMLEKKGDRYYGISKGKKLVEGDTDGITLPSAVLNAIRAAGLDIKKPFAWKTRLKKRTTMNASAIQGRINKHLQKLYKEGKVKAAFSCHDFRHFFAVQEYGKDKDIYRVSALLGHANVAITQTYLKSLKVKI